MRSQSRRSTHAAVLGGGRCDFSTIYCPNGHLLPRLQHRQRATQLLDAVNISQCNMAKRGVISSNWSGPWPVSRPGQVRQLGAGDGQCSDRYDRRTSHRAIFTPRGSWTPCGHHQTRYAATGRVGGADSLRSVTVKNFPFLSRANDRIRTGRCICLSMQAFCAGECRHLRGQRQLCMYVGR